MSSFNLNDLGEQLKGVTQNSTGFGVSFAKKSLKLDSAEDAKEVVEAIRACTNLEYLDLEGNTLGPDAAMAVAEALKENGSLLKRALWKDMFTGRLKAEIPKSLEYLSNALCGAGTQLTELDLSDNAFGPVGVRGIASFLTSSSCYTLRILKLHNTGLGATGGKIVAKALLDCYNNSSKAGTSPLALKVFVAGRNRLEDEGAEALASVFQKLTSLEEVVMPQNGIYHQGITAIAHGLSSNPGLKILNLNDNTVGFKGAQALAKALPNFQNLEQLNLGDCLLKTQGSLILAEALGVEGNYPSLTELNLSYNEIRKEGANSIAQAMADKKRLITLELDGNSFGRSGRTMLCNLLKDSRRIESLGSLSNDEESDDEDTDEDDEEEDEEEVEKDDDDDDDDNDDDEEEDEDDESDIENKENGRDLKNTVTNGNESSNVVRLKISVTEFLKSPTGERLLLLQDNIVQDFIDHAKTLSRNGDTSPELRFIEEYTRIVMKVSALSTSGYIDVKTKAQNLTDILYSKLCSFAKESDKISIWNNALLVNLGLIKAEDKCSEKIDWNLEGCFKALEQVTQKDYFPEEIRTTLKIFLEKSIKNKKAKVTDSIQDSKNSLNNVLSHMQNAGSQPG
ncbi:ran GTPase activating protein [Megachile rotundata]|uniref:ran GTPase activating protein n=1 Tax=Megachile rotundata TaxID=143995 RepID=UPI003FCFEDBC